MEVSVGWWPRPGQTLPSLYYLRSERPRSVSTSGGKTGRHSMWNATNKMWSDLLPSASPPDTESQLNINDRSVRSSPGQLWLHCPPILRGLLCVTTGDWWLVRMVVMRDITNIWRLCKHADYDTYRPTVLTNALIITNITTLELPTSLVLSAGGNTLLHYMKWMMLLTRLTDWQTSAAATRR